ncbi:hypothetical protein [Streptomyces lasalocidi]|uniref:Uncharacterized protein n=1 Tax=Streptomyces lasalocidi TaxID=324833 RepID=A0A4U5WQ48_STRLS|nr:hypothetical protein [Streptomyces lasalocidi]TKT03451.1 hypothetical protein E4U91_27390 [Streptomyces lasalocidi]
MAEYLVKATYRTYDTASLGVAFDVNDLEPNVPITRGEIEDAVANGIADALNALLTSKNVDDLNITAVRFFDATENIPLT